MIDSPVGRTTRHAEQGKLVLMLGGDDADIAEVQHDIQPPCRYLHSLGAAWRGVGNQGCQQLPGLTCCAVSAEAFALGVRAGLSVEHMLTVFGSTMAANAQALTAYPQFALRQHRTRLYGRARPQGPSARPWHGEGIRHHRRRRSAAFEAFGEARRHGHDRDDVTSILGLREDEAASKSAWRRPMSLPRRSIGRPACTSPCCGLAGFPWVVCSPRSATPMPAGGFGRAAAGHRLLRHRTPLWPRT